MSRREDIDNAIWADPDFEALSAHATLLYLWGFTNPRCGMSGLYKVSRRAMTESKVPLDQIPAALDELAAAGFAFYEGSVLWVRTRVKHLRSRSPQMAKSIANDLRSVPASHPLRIRFLNEYGSQMWLRQTLSETSGEPIENLSEKPTGKGDSHTVSGTSPEVPGQWQGQGQGQGQGTSTVNLPDDFPRELSPHLRVVFRVLRDLARRHNAKAVSPMSLVSVVMGHAHKPLVRAAFDYAAWADGRAQRRKDVVAGYRNWLDKTDDLASFEQIGPNGLPVGAVSRSTKENASSMLRDLGVGWMDSPDLVDVELVEDAA
jgi:hypothetical protein